MSALDELKKKEEKTDLDVAVISSAYYEKQATGFSGRSTTIYSEKAAVELLALRERVAKLEESIKAAQVELHATQRNWDEECLFECNDILTAALKSQ